MKSFKEYLIEAAEYSVEKLDPSDFGDSITYPEVHTAKIGNHELEITHHVTYHNDGSKHLNTDFTVNGNTIRSKKNPPSPLESAQIYHTVKNSMSHMIKGHRPTMLDMDVADERYADSYQRIAEHIARRFGGTAEKTSHGMARVNFDWDKKSAKSS